MMVTWDQFSPFLTLLAEVQSFNKWIIRYLRPWVIETTSYYRVISLLSLLTHETLVLIFHALFSSFSFSRLLSVRLAPFSLTVRRYLKDQITMATISHIVIAHTRIWWLFLFWRVCQCSRTSLADRQITCSGEEGTMLPSVGSTCLHTASDAGKHTPAFLWWLMTDIYMPIKLFVSTQELYVWVIFHNFAARRNLRRGFFKRSPPGK